MSAIEPQLYEGYGLAEKYAWVNGQPGLRAVEAAADSVRTMGRKLDEITTSAGTGMRDLGVNWAGPASDAAQQSSRRIVDRAVRTQSLADNGADRILDYGHSFDEMRRRVAFEDPRELSWVEMAMEPGKYVWDNRPWGSGEDHVSIVTRNQEHDAAANDALRWHEANARRADDGFVTDGVEPDRPPIGAGAAGSGAADGTAGGVGFSPTTAAASAAPAGATAAGSGVSPPGVPSPPVTGAAPAGVGAAPVPVTAMPGGSTAGGGARPGAPGGIGGIGGPSPGGPRGTGDGVAGAGTTGPAGGGASDAARQRAQWRDMFQQDLANSSPGARSGAAGTATLPGAGGYGVPGGRYGSGGPGTGRFGTGAPGSGGHGTGSYGTDRYGSGVPGSGGFGAGGRTAAPGNGWASGGGTGRGLLPGEAGARAGTGSGLLPGEGGSRAGSGGGLRGGLPGEGGWGRAPGEGTVARPVAGEPAAGRPGAGYGPGYGPMMGGVGGARSGGEEHRNRYLVPSSEPFDVDVPSTPAVLTPDEEG